MILEVDDDGEFYAHVDRDGSANAYPKREGFNIYLQELRIHFQDETNAALLAKLILWRLGESYNSDKKPTKEESNAP